VGTTIKKGLKRRWLRALKVKYSLSLEKEEKKVELKLIAMSTYLNRLKSSLRKIQKIRKYHNDKCCIVNH
jgi:hypothetical protein